GGKAQDDEGRPQGSQGVDRPPPAPAGLRWFIVARPLLAHPDGSTRPVTRQPAPSLGTPDSPAAGAPNKADGMLGRLCGLGVIPQRADSIERRYGSKPAHAPNLVLGPTEPSRVLVSSPSAR